MRNHLPEHYSEDEETLRTLEAMKPNLKEIMSSSRKQGVKNSKFNKNQSADDIKAFNYNNFRKNMFSLREDLQIMNFITNKGEKSERQIFRELVIEMNRSDEALKTRYKSYLKPLNEVDK
jgi:hypothetical protein